MPFPAMFIPLAALLFSSMPVQIQTGTVIVKVNGFENGEGKARILVFSEAGGEYFPSEIEKAYKKYIVPIVDGKVLHRCTNIPYGDYAVSVHHDEDGDGEVDTNWLGIPNEGLGASNNATGFFGPPSFEDAKVTLNRKTITTVIDIVN